MKIKLFIVAIVLSFTSYAQFSEVRTPIHYYKPILFDSLRIKPSDTTGSKTAGNVIYKASDKTFYIADGIKFNPLAGGGSPTVVVTGTVAELRAMHTNPNTTYFSTDFGGGIFDDAGIYDGQYNDDGAQYIVTASNRVLKRRITGDIDPKWWGAVANGTDQSAKINAAITAASLYQGGKSVVINDTFSIAGTASIIMKSYVKLLFQKGGAIKLLPNNTGSYEIISVNGIHDAEIVDPVIIGDNDAHIGAAGEFGMGIYIVNSKNITIQNATIRKCWGDGIYIGSIGSNKTLWNDNIKVLGKLDIRDCRRQGVSLICGTNIYIEYLSAKHIEGTAPAAAIDFEPNDATQDITARVGTIEADSTDAAFIFVHLGGYYDITIDKVIDLHSRNESDDGGYIFLGSTTAAKNAGRISIGEIIRDKVTSHPLFLVKDWYKESSPKITIGKLDLDVWNNSSTSADNKYSVLFQFLSTTDADHATSGNFQLLDLNIDSINFQNGKTLRPYYITGPANINQITLSDVLINFQKLPRGIALGDGQNVFKTSSTVDIRQSLDFIQSIEKKTASFSPVNGKQYSVTTNAALDLVLSGFNYCTLYGLSTTPSTIYLVSNVSNSRLSTFTYEGSPVDTSGGTPHFTLNPGDRVLLERINLSELRIKLVEKTNIPDFSTTFIANKSVTGTEQIGSWDVSGNGALSSLEFTKNDYTTWKAAQSFWSMYSTGGAGASYPFNEAGHAVLQTRASGAYRNFIVSNGIVPLLDVKGATGNVDIYGRVSAANATASNELTTLGQNNALYTSKADLSGRVIANANGLNTNDFFYMNGANQPPGTTDGTLYNFQYNSSYQFQMFFDWRENRVHTRSKAGGGFVDWGMLATMKDLGDTIRAYKNTFFFHNGPGTGDSLIHFPNDSTAIAKRIEIIGATKDVTADKITYTIAPNINGTVSFTGDGSTTSFTIPLSVAGLSPTSKIFLTAKTAVGAAINWVDVSTESITVYYLTAPTSGLKTLNYILVP